MIKSGFDFIAPVYDKLAQLVFGTNIRQAQTTFIANLPAQASILIIGGGTGFILPVLLAQTSPLKIVYLEASLKMLHQARQRLAPEAAAPVEFRLGTEKDILPKEQFEVVITHFFLDLFAPVQLEEIVNTVLGSLKPGGIWLIADFVKVPGAGLWQVWTRILIKSMYAFFRLLSGISAVNLPDWENLLTKKGLVPQKSAYFYQGMIKSVLYQKPSNY